MLKVNEWVCHSYWAMIHHEAPVPDFWRQHFMKVLGNRIFLLTTFFFSHRLRPSGLRRSKKVMWPESASNPLIWVRIMSSGVHLNFCCDGKSGVLTLGDKLSFWGEITHSMFRQLNSQVTYIFREGFKNNVTTFHIAPPPPSKVKI